MLAPPRSRDWPPEKFVGSGRLHSRGACCQVVVSSSLRAKGDAKVVGAAPSARNGARLLEYKNRSKLQNSGAMPYWPIITTDRSPPPLAFWKVRRNIRPSLAERPLYYMAFFSSFFSNPRGDWMPVKQLMPMQVPRSSTNPASSPASTSGIKYSCGICRTRGSRAGERQP